MRAIYKKIDYKDREFCFDGLAKLVSVRDNPAVLGGNRQSRFSYFCFEPIEIFEFATGQRKPFEKLEKILAGRPIDRNGDLPSGMFVGGWVGYFAYELGRFIEKVPERAVDDIVMPIIRLCFYDKVICFDSKNNCCYLLSIGGTEKIAELEGFLVEAKSVKVDNVNAGDIENVDIAGLACNIDRGYYERAFEKIKKYIYDGDVYQINFSQRFAQEFIGDGVDLFRWHNAYNPCGYSAYIKGSDFEIVSSSPEMFITKVGDVISTKPIKGTRKRIAGNERANELSYADLLGCEKEKAELNMIIDLERNDLGRICRAGTIKVVQPRTIEAYPTVLHGVATVEGRLKDGISFCDILRAMFPGGSITGAPKIRSMEIIDELEPTGRGVYTGSIGYIGIDGSVCLNIAIRTVIIKGHTAYMQVGGGIVADSDADAEWDETITKVRAMVAGVRSQKSEVGS